MSVKTVNEPVTLYTCDRCSAAEQIIGYDAPDGWRALVVVGVSPQHRNYCDVCAPIVIRELGGEEKRPAT